MQKTVLLIGLAILIVLLIVVVVIIVKSLSKGGSKAPKAPRAPKKPKQKSTKQAKSRLNKMKKGKMDIEPEDEDEDDLYSFTTNTNLDDDLDIDPFTMDDQPPAYQAPQQQSQPQPVAPTVPTMSQTTVAIDDKEIGIVYKNIPQETVAMELLKEVAMAISQNSITKLSASTKDPVLRYIASSIYTLVKEGYRRNFEIVNVSNARIVGTKQTGLNEYIEATCIVEYKDYLIKDKVIGNKETIYRKEAKLMFAHDIMEPDKYWLTNTNLS